MKIWIHILDPDLDIVHLGPLEWVLLRVFRDSAASLASP